MKNYERFIGLSLNGKKVKQICTVLIYGRKKNLSLETKVNMAEVACY